MAWRNQFKVMISNVTDNWGCLGLAGPASREILQTITSTDLTDKAFPFLHACNIDIVGVKTRALRISYTGQNKKMSVFVLCTISSRTAMIPHTHDVYI